MKIALLSASLVAFTLAPSANAAWQRLGSIEKRPIDGATSSLSGTKIVASKGIGQPENLLSDDVALSSKVNPGVSDTTIGLGRQIVVELVSLINDGAEGRIAVEGSLDNHKWTPVSQSVFTAADRTILLRFAGANASYVRIQFDLSKGGGVKSASIYGSDTDQDFKVTEAAPGQPSQSINVAGGLGGGRVIYINPSPVGGDETVLKYGRYEFPESPDKFRTVIYDFGKARTLTEIGSVHSPRPVRFYAYAFEGELPEKEDWRGRRSFDPAVFDDIKPVATVEDLQGVGYVKAKLNQSVKARYVALRWEPDFNPPSFVVSGVNISASGLNVTPNNPNGTGGGAGAGNGSGSGNEDGTASNTGDGNTGSGDGAQGSGAMNGAFNNPFALGTGGYGSPGRAGGSTGNATGAGGGTGTGGGNPNETNVSP